MGKVDIVLPAMGEGIIEATITRWMVSVGDVIDEDQSLAEIATDKVDSEIPSPVAGKVKELLFKEGEIPQVGQVIAIIESESTNSTSEKTKQEIEPSLPSINKTEKEQIGELRKPDDEPTKTEVNIPRLSPLVRSIVKREGLSVQEINQVKGTGLHDRITRNDILSYIEKRSKFDSKPSTTSKTKEPSISSPMVEVVQMDRMRKLIADHMITSKQTSAHVTSFIEADVTNLVAWRNREKEAFQKREGQKLTLTPLFIEAVVKAIKQFPMINCSVESDKILIKKSINIGLAAALPNGNLIVPVIKDADKLSLAGISEKVNDLAYRARENKLQPNEIQGGIFTITNLGMFETLTGTPIINQPQVAILAIGAITKRVVVIESEAGDTIGIRNISMLSLSYDHRVVDGALGGLFLKEVRDNLQKSF
jgi:2-oxoglutarate dehydrogenase E2 component (dihydrolipoamide succinyltransferase)